LEWVIDWGPQIAFIGAVILAVGAWATTQQQNRQQAKYDRQIADLHRTVAEMSMENAAKSDQLAAKSDQITQLTQRNLEATTGGDGFCTLTLQDHDNELGARIIVHHYGTFPLYEVQIVLFADPPPPTQGNPRRITFPSIAVGAILTLQQRLEGVKGDRKDYTIRFFARNGRWTQTMNLRRVEGQWRRALVVHRPESGQLKEIRKEVEPGYPSEPGAN
jgi:hypothetical protein